MAIPFEKNRKTSRENHFHFIESKVFPCSPTFFFASVSSCKTGKIVTKFSISFLIMSCWLQSHFGRAVLCHSLIICPARNVLYVREHFVILAVVEASSEYQ